MNQETETKELKFRFRYVILPAVVLAVSIILSFFFFRLLPEEVAYSFDFDGNPSGYAGRTSVVSILLIIQLLVLLFSFTAVFVISRIKSLVIYRDKLAIQPERLMMIIGNMPVVLQLMLSFALLDILSYNAYDIHLMPLWLFAVIISVIGALVLGYLTIPIIMKMFREYVKNNTDKAKE